MGMYNLVKKNAERKAGILLPFIKKNDRVLDFGCGDLSLAKELYLGLPGLDIYGVDVVDFGIRDKQIGFQTYDGKILPFKTGSFDTVIVYHVLHHTDNPAGLLSECMRVSKGSVLLVEPVYRVRFEILGMSVMDWLFNIWKERSIHMTFAFQSKKYWEDRIREAGWHIAQCKDVEIFPSWVWTGRSYLFVCKKKRKIRV